jgi:uncharacterized protein with PIN domain
MLIRLGRWLRAAGYDTQIAAAGVPDRDLVARAVREGRLLITRDRQLAQFREAPRYVVVLAANGTGACARELTSRLDIDWLKEPFTRCVLCNDPLLHSPIDRRAQVPPASRATAAAVLHCARCDKLYWPGGHVRRMRRRLERWQEGEFD